MGIFEHRPGSDDGRGTQKAQAKKECWPGKQRPPEATTIQADNDGKEEGECQVDGGKQVIEWLDPGVQSAALVESVWSADHKNAVDNRLGYEAHSKCRPPTSPGPRSSRNEDATTENEKHSEPLAHVSNTVPCKLLAHLQAFPSGGLVLQRRSVSTTILVVHQCYGDSMNLGIVLQTREGADGGMITVPCRSTGVRDRQTPAFRKRNNT